MHLRALIVLLVVMNIGVALWWALRPDAAAEAAPALPADVPRLILVSEADPEQLRAAALNAANAAQPSAQVAAEGSDPALVDPEELRCFSFGPWAEAADAAAARERLQPEVVRIRSREAATGATGWRVMFPPQADRTQAQAVVERLLAAGFDDHFIIGHGEEANAIALGRFGGEPAARRHEAALHAAGFGAAVAEPLGATGAETWIDLAAGPGFDPDQAGAATGAARWEELDCGRLQ